MGECEEMNEKFNLKFQIGDIIIGKKSHKHAKIVNVFKNNWGEYMVTYQYKDNTASATIEHILDCLVENLGNVSIEVVREKYPEGFI